MTVDQACAILKAHNDWRRWDGELGEPNQPEPQNPRQIGLAIDTVLAYLDAERESL